MRGSNEEWSFHLPQDHRIEVNRQDELVSLATPFESSTYVLVGIEETADEVIVKLGPELASERIVLGKRISWPRGYPLPTIEEERQRLRAQWDRSSLPPDEFDASPAGSTWEEDLARIRARLRALAASPTTSQSPGSRSAPQLADRAADRGGFVADEESP